MSCHVIGLNLICLLSRDAIMVEATKKGQFWVHFASGGKVYMSDPLNSRENGMPSIYRTPGLTCLFFIA